MSRFLALAIISCAILAYEVLLTRLFAIVQWHHFAFMAISIALLGFGVSGAALALWRRAVERMPPGIDYLRIRQYEAQQADVCEVVGHLVRETGFAEHAVPFHSMQVIGTEIFEVLVVQFCYRCRISGRILPQCAY